MPLSLLVQISPSLDVLNVSSESSCNLHSDPMNRSCSLDELGYENNQVCSWNVLVWQPSPRAAKTDVKTCFCRVSLLS